MAAVGGARLWISWRPGWLGKFHELDSFGELRADRFPEIHVSEAGHFAFPVCDPRYPLPMASTAVNLHTPDAAISALQKNRRVIVSVDTSLCYRRFAELPRTAASRLHGILTLDLSRLTPFKLENFYSGFRVLGAGSTSTTLSLEQIVLRKDILKPLSDELRSKNILIEAISFRDGPGPMWPAAIGPDGSPYGNTRFSLWIKLAACGLAAALAGIGLMAIAITLSAEGARATLGAQTLVLQQQAAAIHTRLDVLKSSSDEIADLLAWKSRGDRLSRAIEELSRVLPDDAYLEGFAMDNGQITVDGQAVMPEGLIARLESSPLFNNVSFGAPVFRNPGEAYSHFSIGMSFESNMEQEIQ